MPPCDLVDPDWHLLLQEQELLLRHCRRTFLPPFLTQGVVCPQVVLGIDVGLVVVVGKGVVDHLQAVEGAGADPDLGGSKHNPAQRFLYKRREFIFSGTLSLT